MAVVGEILEDAFVVMMLFLSLNMAAGMSALLSEAVIYHAARLLYGTTLSEDFREKARENLWALMTWVWLIGLTLIGLRNREPLLLVPAGLIALFALVAIPFIIRDRKKRRAAAAQHARATTTPASILDKNDPAAATGDTGRLPRPAAISVKLSAATIRRRLIREP